MKRLPKPKACAAQHHAFGQDCHCGTKVCDCSTCSKLPKYSAFLGGCDSCFLGMVIDAERLEVQACIDCGTYGTGFGSRKMVDDELAGEHLNKILAALNDLRDLCAQQEADDVPGREEEFEEVYRQLRHLTRFESTQPKKKAVGR